jgi:MFS family permease
VVTRRNGVEEGASREEGDAKRPLYRWVVVLVATAVQAATGYVVLGIGALTGFFRDAFDLTGYQTGMVVTAVALAPLFALIPVGRLLDRFGQRLIVTAGGLWLGIGAAVAATASSFPILLAFLFVGGAGYATSQPGGSKAVAGWFRSERRGLAMGIRQTGLPLGGALAAATLPAIAEAHGWQTALMTTGGVAALGAIVFGLVYRDPAPIEREDYPFSETLRRLLFERFMRPILGSGLVLVSAQLCVVAYLLLFLRDVHDIPLTTGAWVLSVSQILGMGGRVALGAWSDKRWHTRRLHLVILSLMMTASFLCLLAWLPEGVPVGAIGVVAALLGFFAFGWYGPWVVHISDIAPRGSVGLTLALSMSATQLGIVAAPPLFGLLLDIGGSYRLAWLVLALGQVIGAAGVAFHLSRASREDSEAEWGRSYRGV